MKLALLDVKYSSTPAVPLGMRCIAKLFAFKWLRRLHGYFVIRWHANPVKLGYSSYERSACTRRTRLLIHFVRLSSYNLILNWL